MFNYPGEYVRYLWEYVTLGSMFNYPGEYFQLPWGVFSITLGSIFNYPGEYVQLPWWVCFLLLALNPDLNLEAKKLQMAIRFLHKISDLNRYAESWGPIRI